ncbi:MAG: hypothetical protein Q7R50_07120 [Dehalococcoidales bacterium]|nr:hypothetical protein [Dehalococcoidales bacterium]
MTSRKDRTARTDHPQAKEVAGSNSYRSTYSDRLEAIDKQPRRHWLIHWSALVLSLVSLGILILGMAVFREPLPETWVWLDIGIGALFAIEFFTRSGFHWNPLRYVNTHLFDFTALVPALMFLHHGVFAEGLWVWLILVTRVTRAFDRGLGDGFIVHNFFALLEGFEEEITDRVTLRIMDRIQSDMSEGKFGSSAADAMAKHKQAVLNRVRAEHPHDGIGLELARWVGLEDAVIRAEERIYDAMVEVLRSHEVDEVIRANLETIFAGLRAEIGKKAWIKHLGIPGRDSSAISDTNQGGSENQGQ